MLLGPILVLAATGLGLEAQAGGGGHGGFAGGGRGGFAGGRGGFAGHVHSGRLKPGFAGVYQHGHRNGRFGHRDGFGRRDGYGNGNLPVGYGYGYGAPPVYDPIYRGESHPAYGIPPSPVLPPAIYVIGAKAGKGGGASVTRGGSRVLTVDSRGAGRSSAEVVSRPDRRYRAD